jgi:uncharacterized repeat protein (TIGR01451 family)
MNKRARGMRFRQIIALGPLLLLAFSVAQVFGAPAAFAGTVRDIANPDTYTCSQPTFIGFEDLAEGTDLSASTFDGLQFTTTGGFTWRVGDFSTGYYNGKYPSGAYTSQGTHWAWLGPSQGSGRIDFTAGSVSTFSLLTSSYTPIYVDAYSAGGALLDSAGPSSSNVHTGHMSELTVQRAESDIAYVLVHDSGNYFEIDSICTDASASSTGPDLSLSMIDSPDPVRVGHNLTYSMQVTSGGPGSAAGVTLTDTIPSELNVLTATPSQGTCSISGSYVSCALGAIPNGGGATVDVVTLATSDGVIENSATVAGTRSDPDPGNNSASATTTVQGAPACTITGTEGSDDLFGTSGDDVICGLGGDDTIHPRPGNDVVFGGDGVDTFNVSRQPVGLTIDLATGLGSAQGSYHVYDVENVTGTDFADKIDGDSGTNLLLGGLGSDQVSGREGNDIVLGGDDNDIVRGGVGTNTVDGGGGSDTEYFKAATNSVTVNLGTGQAVSFLQISDTISSVENVFGSRFDDLISGSNLNNVLNGAQGADRLNGGFGDDQLLGSAGDDYLAGQKGNDALNGGLGTDTCRQGPGAGPIQHCEL